VRVRLAPSPTGYLHIGTARAALFNWLFAKHHGGAFILRLEDTDEERSKCEFATDIYDGLHRLGLHWDEGPDVGGPYAPYVQSERLPIYQQWLSKLIETGWVYQCFLTEAEIEAKRALAHAENVPFVFRLSQEEALINANRLREGSHEFVYRFKVPDDHPPIVVHDAIRSDVTFDVATLGDFVVMKRSGMPTFNFANVVDDITMKITHVIRGEDHLPNTPRQLLMYEAFGETPPVFAHASMILAPDRSKLSKRHGATALSEYLNMGYLPEAVGNFLALLGWSPPDGVEVAGLQHFASLFSLDRIAQSPAVFDIDKLNWLNGQAIRAMALPELRRRAEPFLSTFDTSHWSEAKLELLLDVVREPLTRLNELPASVDYFFQQDLTVAPDLQSDVLAPDEGQKVLAHFIEAFLPEAPFAAASTHEALADARTQMIEALKTFTQSLKPLKPKAVMWPIRAALTGRVHGAELAATLVLLGSECVMTRSRRALAVQSVSP
ncbi:MAG: glutamate--tRNA ligase, partial [Vampirovibrionales bacterium]|nr:glutamate--tRNA ligase [Vampirovibrionales bacterium]